MKTKSSYFSLLMEGLVGLSALHEDGNVPNNRIGGELDWGNSWVPLNRPHSGAVHD